MPVINKWYVGLRLKACTGPFARPHARSHHLTPILFDGRLRRRIGGFSGDEGYCDNDQRATIKNWRVGISRQTSRNIRWMGGKEFGRRQLFANSPGLMEGKNLVRNSSSNLLDDYSSIFSHDVSKLMAILFSCLLFAGRRVAGFTWGRLGQTNVFIPFR